MKKVFAVLWVSLFFFSVCGSYYVFAQENVDGDMSNTSSTKVLESPDTDGSDDESVTPPGGPQSADKSAGQQPADSIFKQSGKESQPAVAKRVQETYTKIERTGFVGKVLDFLSMAWRKIKEFFSNLPGIRQYNESIYSNDNYKKEMQSMGREYRPSDKRAEEESISLLKQGEKKFFKKNK